MPIEDKNFLSQKNFQLFFKIGFSVFQDSGIILSEKTFSELQTNQSPGIAMKHQRQNRERDSTCSDHMERGLDLGCLIASASRGQKFAKLKIFS